MHAPSMFTYHSSTHRQGPLTPHASISLDIDTRDINRRGVPIESIAPSAFINAILCRDAVAMSDHITEHNVSEHFRGKCPLYWAMFDDTIRYILIQNRAIICPFCEVCTINELISTGNVHILRELLVHSAVKMNADPNIYMYLLVEMDLTFDQRQWFMELVNEYCTSGYLITTAHGVGELVARHEYWVFITNRKMRPIFDSREDVLMIYRLLMANMPDDARRFIGDNNLNMLRAAMFKTFCEPVIDFIISITKPDITMLCDTVEAWIRYYGNLQQPATDLIEHKNNLLAYLPKLYRKKLIGMINQTDAVLSCIDDQPSRSSMYLPGELREMIIEQRVLNIIGEPRCYANT